MPVNAVACRNIYYSMYNSAHHEPLILCVQVVGGKITETGRLGAFITKVKKGSLADVVGHLRAGESPLNLLLLCRTPWRH